MLNRSNKTVEVYAHRGARSYAPENVIPGYEVALQIGANWVDMDIGITKDGIIVADHDIWLNPDILSKNGKFWAKSRQEFIASIPNEQFNEKIQPYLVKNLTLKELQEYEAGILNPDSEYAKYFPEQISRPGTHIPSLQEVIDYVNSKTKNQVNFQIEVKNDVNHLDWTVSQQEFASQIFDIIKANNLFNRFEVQSFDWVILYELQKLDSRIKTAYLVGVDDKVRMLNPDPKVAGLWSGGKLLKDYNNSLPQMIKALGGACYEPQDTALTKAELEECHSLGLKVVVWTWPEQSGGVFDPVLVARLIDWGIDGIITDDPGQLISMLAARSLSVPARY